MSEKEQGRTFFDYTHVETRLNGTHMASSTDAQLSPSLRIADEESDVENDVESEEVEEVVEEESQVGIQQKPSGKWSRPSERHGITLH